MRKHFLLLLLLFINSSFCLNDQTFKEESSEFWRADSSSAELEERERFDDSDEGVFRMEGPIPRPEAKFIAPEKEPTKPAGIRSLDIESFCFGNGEFFALGPCSSTFLKCGRFNANRRFTFEECPLGSVFVGKECKPARKVRDCFLPQINLLNDATEKLAQAVDFCTRKDPFEPALFFFDGPAEEDKCSRQALLCRGGAVPPLGISCPPGKVLDAKAIRCIDALDQCNFVPGSAQTPIRLHLLRLACAQQKASNQQPFTAPLFPQAMQAQLAQQQSANTKDRCRNWYFVCESGDEPDLVFCDNGKMFDPAKHVCRRILPEDRCPHLGACRGWEWRMSPVGECRPDFLFCNGMRPQLFQCERQGEVFAGGECAPAGNTCDLCQPGQMKRSTEKCEEFFFCEHENSGSDAGNNGLLDRGRTRWRQYMCTNGRLFHPQRRECVPPSEFQCPTLTQCQPGDSYTVECGDFFFCAQSRFVAGKCPDMTRWDAAERRCVFSAQCRRFKDVQKGQGAQTCLDGQTRPSADCKRYEECLEGHWIPRPCREYGSSRLKEPCRFCIEPGSSTLQQQKDAYPLERLLPDGFNPFDGQGVKQRRCVEGEKIVNRHDCARFMECVDGDWFNLACPSSHFFSARTQACVLASSANLSAVPMCQDLLPVPTLKTGSQAESVYLLPLYSPNDTLLVSAGISPGAGPLPELRDEELRQNYVGTFDFCSVQSPQRIPNPYDCTKYRECTLERGGYYAEKQCAIGTQFDPKLLKCTYNYSCTPTNCVEGIQEPMEQCGKARQCIGGKWHEFNCPEGMAFVGAKCSDRVRCQSTNPTLQGICVDGHTRAHPKDCSKYLLCRYGQFLEENCNLGHRFNPKIGRCDPGYECPAEHRPPCYEGEIRAIASTFPSNSANAKCETDYELCRDGRFLRQSCPYKEYFTGGRCQVKDARCGETGQDGNGGAGNGAAASSQKCQESAGPQGFRADRQTCSKFYQCAQGRWVSKECAKGTAFNPTLGVCDWPANVPGC